MSGLGFEFSRADLRVPTNLRVALRVDPSVAATPTISRLIVVVESRLRLY